MLALLVLLQRARKGRVDGVRVEQRVNVRVALGAQRAEEDHGLDVDVQQAPKQAQLAQERDLLHAYLVVSIVQP